MRINCEVQVSNRKLPSLNIQSQKRNSRSSLGLGRPPGSKADVSSLFIHLCTALNKQGTKYKVAGNIEGVFTKFIAEGKFTIRFKEPTHDLCVKADPVLAKSFLSTLKHGLQNKDIDKMHLSNLAPIKQSQVEKPKTTMCIFQKKDYPITTSFPYSLESLMVNGVDLNRVENRMINLKRLRILDLSSNVISKLPVTMSKMQSLTELRLVGNKIQEIDHRIFSGTLAKSLRVLDLSENFIELLPHTLSRVIGLVRLNVQSNCLSKLPVSLGRLKNLKFLNVFNNKLNELPASLQHLALESLDVSSNPFRSVPGIVLDKTSTGVPHLKEIAASFCVRRGLRPTAADIPARLVEYLYSWFVCMCGKICYETHILAHVYIDVRAISQSTTSTYGRQCPALGIFCSRKCFENHMARQ